MPIHNSMLDSWFYLHITTALAIGYGVSQLLFLEMRGVADEPPSRTDDIDEIVREANRIIERMNRGESFAIFDNQDRA